MNAVIMDNAVIGESSIVAASAFVKASQVIPPRTLVAGVPAKIIRPLSEEEMAWKADGTRIYQDLTKRCLATMVETSPLSAVEPDRKRIEMPDVVPLTEVKNRDK
jgi:phenylacetic acid degradation protein